MSSLTLSPACMSWLSRCRHRSSSTVFHAPHGVAVDSKNNVYVTDNNQVLQGVANAAAATRLGFTDLSDPAGVAVDGHGNVYVSDWGNNRV